MRSRFRADCGRNGDLFGQAYVAPPTPKTAAEGEASLPAPAPPPPPANVTLAACRGYTGGTIYEFKGDGIDRLDGPKLVAWAKANLPKFVFIRDYDIEGSRV